MVDRATVTALKSVIAEVQTLLSTTSPLPENRTDRCLELLRAALALADDIQRQPAAKH